MKKRFSKAFWQRVGLYGGLALMVILAMLFVRYCSDAILDRVGTPLPSRAIALTDMDLYTIKPLSSLEEEPKRGDLITLIATLSHHLGGPNDEPVALYESLMAQGAIDASGEIDLNNVPGLRLTVTEEADSEYLEANMLKGDWPILELIVQDESHWLLVVGTDEAGKQFQVYDPNQAETYALTPGNLTGRGITVGVG